jgi:HAD superfamily hydrolase (TIGR01459 family)
VTDLVPPSGLEHLAEIADDYDAILCDVWGVIHNGRAAFAPACEALVNFRAKGGKVCLLTNAPVPKAQVVRYFEPLGVPPDAFDDCVSSGDATRALLARYAGKALWRLGADEGWEHDRFLYDGLDLSFVDDPAKADLGLIIGLRNQIGGEHPEAYRDELAEIAQLGLELVCANPDIQVRIGDRLHWCGGALAQIYEAQGGRAVYAGKPHAAIYDLAYETLAGLGVSGRSRILAIGDGPITDMKGANAQKLDALYVGTGLANHATGDFLTEVRALLADNGVEARYAQPMLGW